MVAVRRADVGDLNTRARTRMTAAGRLTGPALRVDHVEFRAGDRVVCLRNDRRLDVLNGTTGTLHTVDTDTGSVTLTTDRGRVVTLPDRYLQAGHVTHGYAITGHKAQGLTVDHTYVLGSPELYREWGYVAMSRGRASNQLYVCGPLDDDCHCHGPEPPTDPTAAILSRLRRSHAEAPVSNSDRELGDRWRRLLQRLQDPEIHRATELRRRRQQLIDQRQQAYRSLERIEARIGEPGPVDRWRRRHELDELETNRRSRQADRERTREQLAEVDAELQTLPSDEEINQVRDRFRAATDALDQAAERQVEEHRGMVPEYLAAAIGPPPAAPDRHRAWTRAAVTIERHRLRWGITDPRHALGTEPATTREHTDRQLAAANLEQATRQLRTPDRRLEGDLGLAR